MNITLKLEAEEVTAGQFVTKVEHPNLGTIYVSDPFTDIDSAMKNAQDWINWFGNVPDGTVESIYYILSVPETWPGPLPNAHPYSGLHVKIGRAKDVLKRLQNLKTGTSSKLIIHALEPGSSEVERRRHEQFQDDRRQGEWFACSPELASHIINTWLRNRMLPPEHQAEVLNLLDRTQILRLVREVFNGPPDMINPSLNERWYGKVLIDLVWANPMP